MDVVRNVRATVLPHRVLRSASRLFGLLVTDICQCAECANVDAPCDKPVVGWVIQNGTSLLVCDDCLWEMGASNLEYTDVAALLYQVTPVIDYDKAVRSCPMHGEQPVRATAVIIAGHHWSGEPQPVEHLGCGCYRLRFDDTMTIGVRDD